MNLTRRQLLQDLSCGIGGIGLAAYLGQSGLLKAQAPVAGRQTPGPHHAPKARSLIFLNMMGGPSQFETFDYKPEMDRWAGQNVTVTGGRVIGNTPILPSQWRFRRHGQAGHWVSELFPYVAQCADELCVIKSMVCEDNNHPGAQREIMTGYNRRVMPSFGSWILYGLGSANRNLPGFVHLAEGNHHASGFLPAETQGMPVGNRMPNLVRPATITADAQRQQLDLVQQLNRMHLQTRPEENDLAARIEAGELAFRMQMAAPEAIDITRESTRTLALYGITSSEGRQGRSAGGRAGLSQTTADFGAMCLVARRLVEREVRVITINVGGRRGWDQHNNLKSTIAHNASVIDQPIAGLLTDLKSRGLLESTLVLWGGEFGRTPNMQSLTGDSRAHFTNGYTMWLAGGGVRAGLSYGQTDPLGREVVENRVHVHDLHATILHLMGLDPDRLTFRYGGREHKLTDIDGRVITGVVA